MPGYIKLYRDIEDHWIWLDSRHFQWWLQLLFFAAWENKTVAIGRYSYTVHRGQIITSIRFLAARFNASPNTVISFLTTLEKESMIARESSKKMTLITIVNYDKYQFNADENGVIGKPSVQRKVQRKLHQNKEDKTKEEINTSTFSRDKENEFFNQLKESRMFIEDSCKTFNCDAPTLLDLASKFLNEVLAKEKPHPTLAEFKQHFFNWARLAISKESGAKNLNRNGKSTKDKYEARRGTDVSAKSIDEYNDSF